MSQLSKNLATGPQRIWWIRIVNVNRQTECYSGQRWIKMNAFPDSTVFIGVLFRTALSPIECFSRHSLVKQSQTDGFSRQRGAKRSDVNNIIKSKLSAVQDSGPSTPALLHHFTPSALKPFGPSAHRVSTPRGALPCMQSGLCSWRLPSRTVLLRDHNVRNGSPPPALMKFTTFGHSTST